MKTNSQIKSEKPINVLVTGSNGQLGKCIENIREHYNDINFITTTRDILDISEYNNVVLFFEKHAFDYVLNCAAYTNVEQAEKDSKDAFLINAQSVKNISLACKKTNTTLIHVSTDYVFDGMKNTPYTEKDVPNPLSVYGMSKWDGEKHIQEILEKYFIVRTSWLYSQYGKNFYKTIVQKTKAGEDLSIVTSETGTPTNANDLAFFLLNIITSRSNEFGIYNFSNRGEATWYDFAEEIVKLSLKQQYISIKKVDKFPTLAKRPLYSVLCKKKAEKVFDLEIEEWKQSLKKLNIEYRS